MGKSISSIMQVPSMVGHSDAPWVTRHSPCRETLAGAG